MRSIALIDYGSGNLRSAEKALQRAGEAVASGCAIVTTDDPDLIRAADGVVLPGVGAFAACMDAFAARPGLIEAVSEAVLDRGVPFLGICVGMQLLAARGLEFGETPGLNWIAGDVRRLEPMDRSFSIPHMGWNQLEAVADHPLFEGLAQGGEGPLMYFTHSFAFFAEDRTTVIAEVDHGGRFPAAVALGNIAGAQFHPEKSQAAGLRLLANFLEWRP